jgi:hypothetical protein
VRIEALVTVLWGSFNLAAQLQLRKRECTDALKKRWAQDLNSVMVVGCVAGQARSEQQEEQNHRWESYMRRAEKSLPLLAFWPPSIEQLYGGWHDCVLQYDRTKF